jgi:hypothetical protein
MPVLCILDWTGIYQTEEMLDNKLMITK